jgi:methyl halide transferase
MSNDKRLDQNFWNERYIANDIGWDLGDISPPIKSSLKL